MGTTSAQAQAATRFAFRPIPIATDADVHVPEGHSWNVLAKWGQPLFSGVTDFDASTGTTADPEGRTVPGTLNNCGAGRTPWGACLTCGGNFNGYFGYAAAIPAEGDSDEVKKAKVDEANKARTSGMKRCGIGGVSRYRDEQFDARFDLRQNPNEPNRHGFIV